jgi:hypothetical protein
MGASGLQRLTRTRPLDRRELYAERSSNESGFWSFLVSEHGKSPNEAETDRRTRASIMAEASDTHRPLEVVIRRACDNIVRAKRQLCPRRFLCCTDTFHHVKWERDFVQEDKR